MHFQHCCNLKELFVRKNKIATLSEVFSYLKNDFDLGGKMKHLSQVLWLRPLRKLSSLMMSENPCSEGSSVYRHTGCSMRIHTNTQTHKHIDTQTHMHTMLHTQTYRLQRGDSVVGFDNWSLYFQCCAHSRNWRSWTMLRWFESKLILQEWILSLVGLFQYCAGTIAEIPKMLLFWWKDNW